MGIDNIWVFAQAADRLLAPADLDPAAGIGGNA